MTPGPEGGSAAQHQIVCGAVAAAPLVYMGVISALKFSGALPENGFGAVPPEAEMPISLALLAGGILSSLASIVLKKALIQSQGDGSASGRFKGVLVAMAVSESGAVMGLVLMLLTGNLLYGSLLCGLSFAVTCFHFPSRYWLEHGDRPL